MTESAVEEASRARAEHAERSVTHMKKTPSPEDELSQEYEFDYRKAKPNRFAPGEPNRGGARRGAIKGFQDAGVGS